MELSGEEPRCRRQDSNLDLPDTLLVAQHTSHPVVQCRYLSF